MKKQPDLKNLEARFIDGERISERCARRPWDDVDDRVKRIFNLRLPETLYLKLKFISENTPKSMHGFALENLEKAVEEKLDKIID